MAKISSKKPRKPVESLDTENLRVVEDAIEETLQTREHPAPDTIQASDSSGSGPGTEAIPAEAPSELRTPLAAAWPSITFAEQPAAPEAPKEAASPPPAAAKTVNVCFALFEPGAKQVSLSGDFNGWSATATPMKRGNDGRWETSISLAPGVYQYKFVVDGQWIPDPLAQQHVWNYHGTLNSIVEVRA